MKNALKKFRNNFDSVRNEEAGDVIQNVLMIAVFVIIAGIVGSILYKAITDQANNTKNCIAGVGTKAGLAGNGNSSAKCK